MCNLKVDIKVRRDSFALELNECLTAQVTGVFGPSGSGKSTLLNAIAGLQKPQRGFISLNGRVITDTAANRICPPHKRKIGYVFQESRLFPHLNVRKNLLFGVKLKSGGGRKINFDDVVNVLDIAQLLDKNINECSGGEQQRIAIGRALLTEPGLLLLDEPFSAVDYQLRKQILLYIKQISQNWQIPMLVVSHDLSDLLILTQSLLVLKEGKVEGNGLFHDLVVKESCFDLIHRSGLLNVFRMNVSRLMENSNLVTLKSYTHNFCIQALFQSLPVGKGVDDEVQVLVKPDDIAVSLEPVTGISIRNQIKGVIKDMFEKDGYSLCMVDSGEKILVEITEASRQKMNLLPGQTVYCFFKSVSVKIF
ncbi:Molybdenum ABC transporter ATP-binding protein ModC [hydrothermal vent metagenome]|uniref:Molybdenum ABC transporter ATP-binding protein ModC n=1 Tax=hydrothermal vent metagenome TaxID=652676 RepID=A0A3B0TVQ2_9ZZZZ